MMRGTFANIRIKNQMAPGTEGGVTKHIPSGEVMSIFDAAQKYAADNKDLVVFAGGLYGNGSSRDWAAKGTILLGVKAVIASSFERIHRSNLIGMGVLPLELAQGDTWQSLGMKGSETVSISGISDLEPRGTLDVKIDFPDGSSKTITAKPKCVSIPIMSMNIIKMAASYIMCCATSQHRSRPPNNQILYQVFRLRNISGAFFL